MPNSGNDATQRIGGAAPINLNGVDDYIHTRPNALRGLWWAVAVFGVLLLGWQGKGFFIEQYAQHPDYRRYLVSFCNLAGCQLSPRQDPSRVTLTAVKIAPHPRQPGAVRVMLKLVNEATFAQPYPVLQLTLTDRHGVVVGRRSFSPAEYLMAGQRTPLNSGELGAVQLELAHPHEKAVGFAVAVLGEILGGGGGGGK